MIQIGCSIGIDSYRVDVWKYIDNTRNFLLEEIGKQGTKN